MLANPRQDKSETDHVPIQINKSKPKIYICTPSIRDRVLWSGVLLYLHHINFKLFFHPAKFDNFKDETISDFKTVSVPQSQILAGLKTLGLVGL